MTSKCKCATCVVANGTEIRSGERSLAVRRQHDYRRDDLMVEVVVTDWSEEWTVATTTMSTKEWKWDEGELTGVRRWLELTSDDADDLRAAIVNAAKSGDLIFLEPWEPEWDEYRWL